MTAVEPAASGVDLAGLADAVPEPTLERLAGPRRVLIACHENPDADTLGAGLALARMLEHRGASVIVACADPVPALYEFLPAAGRVVTEVPADAKPDLLVLTDCATPERVGELAVRHPEIFTAGRVPRVVIDHHVSNEDVREGDWIDPAAAATCELVALLAVRFGIPLSLDDGALATELMAGIVMDTATFAHPNATPRTLTVSAALLAAGAPLSEISRQLYRTKPAAQLRLFGRVLDRLETSGDGRVVWSTLDDPDYEATGAVRAHSEGIIDLLAQSDAAEVAILFKSAGPSTTRLSVRTKPGGVDATVLTGRYGGGGHARAAGASLDLPLAEARERVVTDARQLAAEVRR
ncbi:MAG TPA: DHH family phosphoesterase [Candidatus Limnocylindrales bacterium]|nr:DHH family phosphoesterase [Candidatus Limnocylindrales bacterium]